MAGDTDFVALYAELGLGADCTAEQLKQAYRRRVGELHPDRSSANDATGQLQRLNGLYEAAMEFQRVHGRLPGAVRPVARSVFEPRPPLAATGPTLVGRRRARWRYALPAAAALSLLLLLPQREVDAPAAPDAGTAPIVLTRTTPAPESTAKPEISVGMVRTRVQAIEGPPVSGYDDRWEYGPSWIAFRCGKVVDWYSSPLRPLQVSAPSAPAAKPVAASSRGC